MAHVRVGSLPVVEGTRLVGIVTEHDVLKALAATLPRFPGVAVGPLDGRRAAG